MVGGTLVISFWANHTAKSTTLFFVGVILRNGQTVSAEARTTYAVHELKPLTGQRAADFAENQRREDERRRVAESNTRPFSTGVCWPDDPAGRD
jgi:hypothetical protein